MAPSPVAAPATSAPLDDAEVPLPEPDGFCHPRTEAQLCALVRSAAARGLTLRVRGSAHSVEPAIVTDARRRGDATGQHALDVMLDRYTGVTFDDAKRQVTVQAGCRFGRDPRDPTGTSTVDNGLCPQLDARGWALPVLGGVSHQTVAGFFATGSAGASRAHDLGAQLVSLRLIDAAGNVHDVAPAPGREPELFHAAGVSLGVLGVISSVTLQCVERFDVEGEEVTARVADCGLDLFGEGPRSLERFFAEHEYARVLWWPQPGVDKVTVWTARRAPPAPSGAEAQARPYAPFDPVLGSTLPVQALAGLALQGMPHVPERLRAPLYNAFVPADPQRPRRFRDTWWKALPHDDLIDERLLPTTFTELFIPASRAGEAMRRLRDHFARGGHSATGTFTVELYPAPRGRFLLSPAQGEDAVRLNFFWFERTKGSPQRAHFPQFWRLLDDLDATLHWAKILPAASTVDRLRARYPGFETFLRAREALDPQGLFLNAYWRHHLGLGPSGKGGSDALAGVLEPTRRQPPASAQPAWPLLFRHAPATESFAVDAPFVFDLREHIAAAPELIYDTMTQLEDARAWLPGFVAMNRLTGSLVGPGSVYDEAFTFMTLRIRTVSGDRGRRWVGSVDAASLPLATRMLELLELEPLPDGTTRVRWRICYAPLPQMRLFHPLVRPVFARFFRTTLSRLKRHLEARG